MLSFFVVLQWCAVSALRAWPSPPGGASTRCCLRPGRRLYPASRPTVLRRCNIGDFQQSRLHTALPLSSAEWPASAMAHNPGSDPALTLFPRSQAATATTELAHIALSMPPGVSPAAPTTHLPVIWLPKQLLGVSPGAAPEGRIHQLRVGSSVIPRESRRTFLGGSGRRSSAAREERPWIHPGAVLAHPVDGTVVVGRPVGQRSNSSPHAAGDADGPQGSSVAGDEAPSAGNLQMQVPSSESYGVGCRAGTDMATGVPGHLPASIAAGGAGMGESNNNPSRHAASGLEPGRCFEHCAAAPCDRGLESATGNQQSRAAQLSGEPHLAVTIVQTLQ